MASRLLVFACEALSCDVGGTHQVAEVAERVPGQLHDALREPPLVADEAGDDGGQAVPGPVQHDGGGGSPHRDFGAAAP